MTTAVGILRVFDNENDNQRAGENFLHACVQILKCCWFPLLLSLGICFQNEWISSNFIYIPHKRNILVCLEHEIALYIPFMLPLSSSSLTGNSLPISVQKVCVKFNIIISYSIDFIYNNIFSRRLLKLKHSSALFNSFIHNLFPLISVSRKLVNGGQAGGESLT